MPGPTLLFLSLSLLFLLTEPSPVWEEWGGHRYFFSEKFPEVPDLPYHNASVFCEEIGGQLASSLNEEENGYLVLNKVRLYETCWIGLYTEQSRLDGCDSCVSCARERFLPHSHNCDLCNACRDAWMWKDGSPMDWWRWHHAQPDDHATCARLHGDGKWFDDDCNKELCFICKQSTSDCVPATDCGQHGFWNCRTEMCTCIHGYWGDQCEMQPTTTTTTTITTESHITTPVHTTTQQETTKLPSITTTEESTTEAETTTVEQSITTTTENVYEETTETSPIDASTSTDIDALNALNDHQRDWQMFGLGTSDSIIIVTIVSLLGIIVFLVGFLLVLKSKRRLYRDDGSSGSSLLSFIKGSSTKSSQAPEGDQYIDAYNQSLPAHESFVSSKPEEHINSTQEKVKVIPSVAPYAVTDLCDSFCKCTKCQAPRHQRQKLHYNPPLQYGEIKSATLERTNVAPNKPLRKLQKKGLNYIQSNANWEDAYYFSKPVLAFNNHVTPGSRPLRLPRYDEMRQQCYTDRSQSDDSIVSVYDVPRQPRRVTSSSHSRQKRADHVSSIHEDPEDTQYQYSVEIHPNYRELSNDSSILENVYATPLKTSTMEHSPPKKPARKRSKNRQTRLHALKGEFDNSGIWYTTY